MYLRAETSHGLLAIACRQRRRGTEKASSMEIKVTPVTISSRVPISRGCGCLREGFHSFSLEFDWSRMVLALLSGFRVLARHGAHDFGIEISGSATVAWQVSNSCKKACARVFRAGS